MMKNKHYQKNYSLYVLILLALVITNFSSCKKSQDVRVVAVPAITEILPSSGAYSTIVTISGSGFSSNAAENLVKFNSTNAIVQTASATRLVVVVPKGAGSGAVTVQTAGKTATGPTFSYVYTVTVSTLAGSGI